VTGGGWRASLRRCLVGNTGHSAREEPGGAAGRAIKPIKPIKVILSDLPIEDREPGDRSNRIKAIFRDRKADTGDRKEGNGGMRGGSNRFAETDARLSYKRVRTPRIQTPRTRPTPPHPAFSVGGVETRRRARRFSAHPATAGFKM
jgi:hypothetical protein